MGEAFGAAAGDRLHVEQIDERVDTRLQLAAGNAVQFARVLDVLARGQARIEPARIGQDADAAARFDRIVRDR